LLQQKAADLEPRRELLSVTLTVSRSYAQ